MKYIGLFLALGIVGCSSSSTNEAATPSTGGAAGQAGSNTGGEAGSSTGGVAGSGGSTTGGTGGVAGSGGVAGTPSGGGTGGTCVPKTCDTYSFDKTGKTGLACGVINDGCGNVVDCGGCDPFFSCGGNSPKQLGPGDNAPMTSQDVQKPNTGVANICNGGCIEEQQFVSGAGCNAGAFYVACPYGTEQSSAPKSTPSHTFSSCVPGGPSIGAKNGLFWCCYL